MPEIEGQFVAGVDSVPESNGGGWVMAISGVGDHSPVGFVVWSSFAVLWSHACKAGYLVVAVDMPIGLPSEGHRAADLEARAELGSRTSKKQVGRESVFYAPPPFTLEIDDHAEANKLSYSRSSRGLSSQAHALRKKISEVRRALQPGDFHDSALPRAAEVHPEVCFKRMAGRPMSFKKSCQAGVAERLEVLKAAFPNIVDSAMLASIPSTPEPDMLCPGLDDVLDAVAAAWTARRLATPGSADDLGDGKPDEDRYPMTIWV